MGNDKDFSLEDLDKMYEEAIAWEPPMIQPQSAAPSGDPRQLLQTLLETRAQQNNGQ